MASRYVGKQFSTLTLDVGHEKSFREWVSKSDINLSDAMGQILEAGYKLSVSWIDDQVSFCVSLIGTDTTKVNKDSILTSWSSDLEEAILLSVFKHFIMCDGGEWPLRSEGGRWG